MRFSNRTIVSYRTNVLVSHCIPQNHFRCNFSKRGSRGEQGLSNRAVQIRRYQSQSAHQKQPQSLQKYSSKISNNPSLNSVHQYTQQPFIHPPHHTHPEERIWAGRTPRVPDAPRIKHDKMKQFYMVDMRRKRW